MDVAGVGIHVAHEHLSIGLDAVKVDGTHGSGRVKDEDHICSGAALCGVGRRQRVASGCVGMQ